MSEDTQLRLLALEFAVKCQSTNREMKNEDIVLIAQRMYEWLKKK